MRFIKLALISAVVFFVIIFIISSLIPAHVRISRAVNIRGPQKDIAGLVSDLQSWHDWNEMIKGIPENRVWYQDGQLISDSLKLTATLATPDTVRTVWQNNSGKEIAGVFTFRQAGEVTIVQWYFDFHQRWYPWEKFASINFDKQWGPLMERSLGNLKKSVERVQ